MLDFSRFTTLTFDCYGTLIDWETGILNGMRPILAAYEISIDDETLLEHYGALEAAAEQPPYQNYASVLRSVVRGFGERLGFVASSDDQQALVDSLAAWPPFPDTVAALQALSARYSLNVISNIDDDLFALSARLLQAPFDQVITAQQAGGYKPALANFHLALERIGVPHEQVLHVAQSLYHDIAPARQLGLATVWVNRRSGKTGAGATPPTVAAPDLEVPDLRTLVELIFV